MVVQNTCWRHRIFLFELVRVVQFIFIYFLLILWSNISILLKCVYQARKVNSHDKGVDFTSFYDFDIWL
jgi:hypothetical protein